MNLKLKRALLASTVCALPFAANAAPPAPVPYTWTGFYVGGTLGGVYTYASADFVDTVSATYYGYMKGHGTGLTGGFTAGYNWQINPVWLVGLEADYSFANVSTSVLTHTYGGYSLRSSSELNGFGTVRGRVGYLVTPSLMYYVTGGWAYADVKASSNFYEPNVSGCTASFSKTKSGWTLGGGFEWLWMQNTSLKLEYLYADLGKTTALSPLGCTTTFKNRFGVGRLGVNYKF